MFRYICLTLTLVLSLGNVIRLESLNQSGLIYWLSLCVLLFSVAAITIALPGDLKQLQKPKKMKLNELKKQNDNSL